MIEIPLSKRGKNAGKYVALISDEDADLAGYNWATVAGYVKRTVNRQMVSLHRTVLERMLGRSLEKGETVDHINRNPYDNRRENLRVATQRQNIINRDVQSNNKTGYKGVSWNKRAKRFVAAITVNRKTKWLGNFDTPQEAHAVYLAAATHFFGEFATGGNINPSENMPKREPLPQIGQVLRINAIAKKTKGYDSQNDSKWIYTRWIRQEIEPCDVYFVGVRNLQDRDFSKQIHDEDYSEVLSNRKFHRAYLVVFNAHQKPVLVFIEDAETKES